MAEFVFKKMAAESGRPEEFRVDSAATSSEEIWNGIGNPVYPPVRKLLSRKGIDCSGKWARKITAADYDDYDLLIGMDRANMRNLLHFYNNDPEGKIRNLLDFAGRIGEEVADPWYTEDFEAAYRDIYTGCEALYNQLIKETDNGETDDMWLKNLFKKKKAAEAAETKPEPGVTVLDFSQAVCKADLFDELAKKLTWEDWYGKNLDALWDVLTGMPGNDDAYEIILPPEDRQIRGYASAVAEIFKEAGKTVTEK